MTELPSPVRKALDDRLDEAAVQRIWRGVSARRQPARARSSLRLTDWLAFAALAVSVSFAVLVWTRGPRAEPGPLRLVDGSELGALAVRASEAAPRVVELSEGSVITLSPGASLEPLENSRAVYSALLVSGRVAFQVKPGGSRRWIIECGLANVEVTGTRFVIDRAAARTRVAVEEGAVLVRGQRVPDGVRKLLPGQFIDLSAGAPAALSGSPGGLPVAVPPASSPSSPSSPSAPAGPGGAAPEAASSAGRPGSAPPSGAAPSAGGSWRNLVQLRDFKEAYRSLGPGGVALEAERASVDDLMALADVARLSGHPAEAIAPLSRVVSAHGGDPRASLAAFTLGRLYLDSLGNPSAAAAAFSQAIGMNLPSSLREPAYARLIEARSRAGDRAGARAALEQYRKSYPESANLGALEKWVPAE
jgi:transmembrane sensor